MENFLIRKCSPIIENDISYVSVSLRALVWEASF